VSDTVLVSVWLLSKRSGPGMSDSGAPAAR
jgi:hypothetical protein